eukprot:COSAG03_NODE_345_length_8808_cov_5.062349_4_plen_200_part_00
MTGELQLVRQQLLNPKGAPAKPTVEQGEVAVRVPPEALPEVEDTATPYGLTAEQHAKLKELWYEWGHYSSRDRMWKLLQDEAREDGELQERTVNRKGGPVTAATPYGIRYTVLEMGYPRLLVYPGAKLRHPVRTFSTSCGVVATLVVRYANKSWSLRSGSCSLTRTRALRGSVSQRRLVLLQGESIRRIAHAVKHAVKH